MAFPTGWSKKHRIRIDNTEVSGTSDIADFPLLLTEADFSSTIWANSDDGGGDIRFSSDIDGNNQLPCEIVSWDTTAETAEVYVKVTLSHNSDTLIYVWFDNTGETQPARTNTFGSDNVWSSIYAAVYHFENNTNDSTGNQNDASALNSGASFVSGKIGQGVSFDGTSNGYFTIPDDPSFDTSVNRITTQLWGNIDAGITSSKFVLNAESDQPGRRALLVNDASGWQAQFRDDADTSYSVNEGEAITTGTYELVHGVYDQSNLLIYVDGAQQGSDAQASKTVHDFAGTIYVGKHPSVGAEVSGDIDELRFLIDSLSSDWTATEYNAMTSATFTTVEEVFEEEYTETVVVADTIEKSLSRAFSETVSLVQNYARTLTINRTFTETVNVLIEEFSAAFGRVFEETIVVAQNFARVFTANRAFTEVVSLAETLSKNIQKTFSEVVSTVQVFSKSISRSITETISVNQVFNSSITFGRILVENITVSETFTKALTISRIFSETVKVVQASVRRRINGLLAGWTKKAKDLTTSWSKTSKQDTDDWDKTPTQI